MFILTSPSSIFLTRWLPRNPPLGNHLLLTRPSSLVKSNTLWSTNIMLPLRCQWWLFLIIWLLSQSTDKTRTGGWTGAERWRHPGKTWLSNIYRVQHLPTPGRRWGLAISRVLSWRDSSQLPLIPPPGFAAIMGSSLGNSRYPAEMGSLYWGIAGLHHTTPHLTTEGNITAFYYGQ